MSPRDRSLGIGILILTLMIASGFQSQQQETRPPKFIDRGACPFECCQYGDWRVEKETPIYAERDHQSRMVGTLEAGTNVAALTGEVHTVPVRFVVKRKRWRYVPGDVLWVYTYLGEGYFKVRYKGKLI